ncbi:MAG TPA: hypothetical protein VE954_34985, partial [Oligoflexus sp.]|uniref:hypothetical protein n=1 Tax=Oligoflexus sp. TaxID=1971216 RepID=UPI002D581421
SGNCSNQVRREKPGCIVGAVDPRARYLKGDLAFFTGELSGCWTHPKKPALTDAKSEGAVTQKLGVYLILWLCIFLSYVYQPRVKPLELSWGH